MKLMLLASISQSSLQLSFLLSRPSHLIHCPCLTRETAFALLSASSWRRTSSTTIFLLSDVEALRQVGLLAVRPKSPLPNWTCPTMSLCLRADVACCTASDGVHFRPVNRSGTALLMIWSLESFKVIWSLTLEHLYSSVRQFKDPFAVEADVSQTAWDTEPFLQVWSHGSLHLLHSCYWELVDS